MPAETKQQQIDALMDQASSALSLTRYFEAERAAVKALFMARRTGDFERMARIAMPLLEARRQRFQLALDAARPRIMKDAITEDMPVQPGVFVFQPPLVASDARRFRLLALTREVPVAVLCREPLTQIKLTPIVAISPGATIRVRLKPPKGYDMAVAPSIEWIVQALNDLGDSALDSIDPTLPIVRRIDAILDRLDCLPEHENLHLALVQACQQAHEQRATVTDPDPADIFPDADDDFAPPAAQARRQF